jgi:hypothetical protein
MHLLMFTILKIVPAAVFQLLHFHGFVLFKNYWPCFPTSLSFPKKSCLNCSL